MLACSTALPELGWVLTVEALKAMTKLDCVKEAQEGEAAGSE